MFLFHCLSLFLFHCLSLFLFHCYSLVCYKIMFVLFLCILFTLLLIVVLKVASIFLAEVVLLFREELTSYECGFEHYSLSRVPFSLRYFYLTLIFLLFDLEVVLLLFSPVIVQSLYPVYSFVMVACFVTILFVGLVYEWSDGGLDWVM